MFVRQFFWFVSVAFFKSVIGSSSSDLLYGEITVEGWSLVLQKVGDGEVTLTGQGWSKLTSPADNASFTYELSSLATRKPILTKDFAAEGNNMYKSGNCNITQIAVEDKQYSVEKKVCPDNIVQALVIYASDITNTQPITTAVNSIDGFSDVLIDYDNVKLSGSMVCATQ